MRHQILLPLLLVTISAIHSVLCQTNFTPVIGNDTVCRQRLKIEDLQAKNPAQFNMLILALERMSKATEIDDLSYFSISGIHGAPMIPWQQPSTGNYNWDRGYCPHSSVVFLTWHRPYILLMEQILCQNAIYVANQFTGPARITYLKAANDLRFPYWDWSDPSTQSHLPPVMTQEDITVTKPDAFGNPITAIIRNPLYEYSFQSLSVQNSFPGNFGKWKQTKRRPNINGVSNNALADSIMQGTSGSAYRSRRSNTYNALVQTSTFDDFNSQVENIHNVVHTSIGGSGHMSALYYSSFDPIFWLHHNNVERLFTIFQAARPGEYLTSGPVRETFARIATSPSDKDDLFTPLYPFRHKNGAWYRSDDIKNVPSIWDLGYGFPEVPCEYKGRPKTELQQFSLGKINELYKPSGTGLTEIGGANIRNEYSIRLIVDNADIPGSWTFHVFFGKPQGEPVNWALSPNHIGSLAALGDIDGSVKKNSFILIKDLSISESLSVTKIKYVDEVIVEYLTKNLYWKVVHANGTEIEISQIKTLKVACYRKVVKYPLKGKTLPICGQHTYLPAITKGKPGGIESEKDAHSGVLVNGEVVELPAKSILGY